MEKKTVKMKVSDIRVAQAGLNEVIREKKLFPAEVNLAIARNSITLENQMKYHRESVKTLVERFALKDEEGNPVVKNNEYKFETKEDEKAFIQEVSELDKVEMEFEVTKVKYEVLNDGKHDEPTAYDLVALDFMLED